MQRKGFTLVELLVAVGIIGVLASVSVVSLNSVRQKGRDAKRISEVKQMQNALEAYYASNGSYPLSVENLKLGEATSAALCPPNVGKQDGFQAAGCANAYMVTLNRDPSMGLATGLVAPNDKYEYIYNPRQVDGTTLCEAAPCPSYDVSFVLESGSGNFVAKKKTTASPNGITQ